MRHILLAALASVFVISAAQAEEQTISVPREGWRIRFNAPKLTPTENEVPGVFTGIAGRFQLSFFVEKPRCPGPDTDENIYNCFAALLKKNPTVLWDTESGNKAKNGVHVAYMAELKTDKGVGCAFNLNLLFAHGGKWADVHLSFASPTKEDVPVIFDIADSIVVEDEPVEVMPSK